MLHRVEAFVIRSFDYGEGNKIVTLYTETFGKVSVMARGAKKVKSRHSAVTQLFTYGEYTYFKSGQMGTLNHAEIIKSHHQLRENLHMAAYASYLVEMVDRMTNDQEGSAFLYEQLKAALDALEEGKDEQITAHLFEMKMLAFAGYSPVLNECVSCGSSAGAFVFSPNMGGVLCPNCRNKDANAIQVADGTLKLLRLFQQMDLRRIGKVEVKDATRTELKQCMRRYMDIHVGIHWKSRNFLEQMERYEI